MVNAEIKAKHGWVNPITRTYTIRKVRHAIYNRMRCFELLDSEIEDMIKHKVKTIIIHYEPQNDYVEKFVFKFKNLSEVPQEENTFILPWSMMEGEKRE